MGLPFDIEDVFGVALADVLRRSFGFVAVVLGGVLLAACSLGAAEVVMDFDFGAFSDWLEESPWLFLAPVFSGWGVLALPLVIGSGLYCKFAETPHPGVLSGLAGAVALLVLFSVEDLGIERWVAVVLATGTVGSFVWFFRLWGQVRRSDAETHLMGVAIENEMRRQRMRDEVGVVVADADYLRDENPPV